MTRVWKKKILKANWKRYRDDWEERQTWVEFKERPRGLRIGLYGTVCGLVGTGVHGPAADQVVHGLIGDQSWSYGCSILYFLCKREKQFDFLNLVSSWGGWSGDEHGFSKVFDFNMQVVVNGNLKEDQRYRGSLGRKGMGLWYWRLCFGTRVEDSSFCLDFISMNWKSWPNIHAKLLGDLITSFLGIHEDQFF